MAKHRMRIYIFKYLLFFTLISATVSVQAQHTAARNGGVTDAFDNGLDLVLKEKYAAAQHFFEDFIRMYPNDIRVADAKFYMVVCSMYLQQANTEELFEQFVGNNPDNPHASAAYYELGKYNYSKKNYPKVIEYLEKVDFNRLVDKNRYEAKFNLGYAYFISKDLVNASRVFDEIKTKDHQFTYAANYYSGYSKFKNKEYDQAIVDFNVAEKNEAYAEFIPYMIVNIFYQQGKFEELITYINEIEKSGRKISNQVEIQLLKAESHYNLEQYLDASDRFNFYLKTTKDVSNKGVLYRLGYSWFKTEKYSEAIDQFKNVASDKDSLGQYASYYLGQSYLKVQNKNFAAKSLAEAAKVTFNTSIQEIAMMDYAKISYELEHFNDVIATSKKFLSMFPDSKYTVLMDELLGESYLNSNNLDAAIQYIDGLDKKTTKLRTTYQQVTYLKGVEAYNKKNYELAIQYFDKSLANPYKLDVIIASHYWKGESHSVQHKWALAISDYSAVFNNATEDSPYHLKSRYGIGYAYFNTKEYKKAIVHFEAFTKKCDPKSDKLYYGDALIRLADCQFQNKSYSLALSNYDKAISQNVKGTDYAYFQKGLVLGIQQKVDEAFAALDHVITNYPNSPYRVRSVYSRANLSFENSRYQDAIISFSQFLKAEKHSHFVPLALLKRGLAYYNLKEYASSLADFDYILQNHCSEEQVSDDALGSSQQVLTAMGKSAEYDARLEKFAACNPKNQAVEKLRFDAALDQYRNMQYDLAIKNFTKYMADYPQSSYGVEIQYYLADSYYGLGKVDQAIPYYQGLVDKNTKYHEKSLIKLIKIYVSKSEYARALPAAHLLSKTASTKKNQLTAQTATMESYYHLQQYDSTLVIADKIINGESTLGYAKNMALLYQAKSYLKQSNYESAQDVCITLMNQSNDEYGAEANWTLAKSFFDQKNYNQSLESLFELNKTFSSHDKWVGESFMLIAENYISLNELFQAKATLQSIVDHSSDKQLVERAKKRLDEVSLNKTESPE